MGDAVHQPPSLATLIRRLAKTGLGAIRNRAELFIVEWQEERYRLARMLVCSLLFLAFAILAAILITAVVIVLLPEDCRLWGLAGFALVYVIGAIGAWLTLKSLLKKEPFSESIEQLRKDNVWLEPEE